MYTRWVYGPDTGAAHFVGKLGSYSGAGYVQDLHYRKENSRKIIEELKQGLWIRQGTRFITIDFTVYNVNINLFLIGKLTFEFPATGGVLPYQQFTATKLISYLDPADFILMGCQIM